ncbi:hypothetical protein MWU78_20875 [Arenibacter sp. F26102]|uniref:hypothetical protein n=1 Tax=Arenibacter sp. F26102 TaxID=2926416 RepID=UPI001FF18781|nr:hypothetical protein [Arenibacter sp. F26102]MCK0148113.1 hypothetical protein [Arenibacter sp. F26102]
MQYEFKKGFKPALIKYIAIIMGICYLMNPVRQQIISLLHSVTHELELPNYVIPHATTSDYQQVHAMHPHDATEDLHEHVFLNIISSFFSTFNEEDHSSDSYFDSLPLDKHLIYSGYLSAKFPIDETDRNIDRVISDPTKGYTLKSLKPPLNLTNNCS